MSDGEYSQKEEDTFRKELFRRMDNQDSILGQLLTQTTKTNGRVNKHDWYFSIMWWSLGLIGSGIVFVLTEIIHKII